MSNPETPPATDPATESELDPDALESLRYPVGRFRPAAAPTPAERREWLEAIAALPARLRAAVDDLTDERLDTRYRPEGWTVRQVVHHVADSHVNAYVRFSLALWETDRSAGLYDEKAWAAQPFARTGPIEPTLALLDGLHARWVEMCRLLEEPAFRRGLKHPEWGTMTVDDLLALYAWHSRHHVAHIERLRQREGWTR